MNKTIAGCTLGMALMAALNLSAQTPKQDIKNAGKEIKTAGKATGEAAKDAGNATVKETKKGTHAAAKGVRKGAKKIEDKTKP